MHDSSAVCGRTELPFSYPHYSKRSPARQAFRGLFCGFLRATSPPRSRRPAPQHFLPAADLVRVQSEFAIHSRTNRTQVPLPSARTFPFQLHTGFRSNCTHVSVPTAHRFPFQLHACSYTNCTHVSVPSTWMFLYQLHARREFCPMFLLLPVPRICRCRKNEAVCAAN